jgi:hypothetical protein
MVAVEIGKACNCSGVIVLPFFFSTSSSCYKLSSSFSIIPWFTVAATLVSFDPLVDPDIVIRESIVKNSPRIICITVLPDDS